MKKKLIVLCVLVVLIMGLAVNAHATEGKIAVGSQDMKVAGGTEFVVPIKVTNVAGNFDYAINAVVVKVQWVDADLTHTGYTAGDVSSSWSEKNGQNVGYQDGTVGMFEDFTLINLKFKAPVVTQEKTTKITLTMVEAFDDENEITDSFECISPTITITAHTHDDPMKKTEGTPATETTPGTKDTWYCEGCKKTFLDENGDTELTEDNANDAVIPALGHQTEKIAAKTPTCTEPGNNEYFKCKNCGKYFKDADAKTETTVAAETIAATGHKMTKNPGTPATCKEDGVKDTWTCSNSCGKTYLDEDGKTVATEENKVIDKGTIPHTKPADASKIEHKDATYDEEGYDKYECDVCHQPITDVIPKLTPTPAPENSKNPSAPKTGDESNIALWVVLFVVCAAVVTVVATKKLRKN